MIKRLLAATLVAATSFTLPAAQAQEVGPTLKKIADSGAIHIGYRESSVPFSYLDGTRPVGFAMDLCSHAVEAIKAHLKRPDIKTDLQPVTSVNRIPLVLNGTVDLECGSTTNNSVRRTQVEFAINHFYTGTRLLTKKTSGIKDWPDLKGKKVSTTSGTTNFQVLRKYNKDMNLDIDVLSGKDHADAMLLVESDRVAAFAMDDVLLFGLAANSKGSSWISVGSGAGRREIELAARCG